MDQLIAKFQAANPDIKVKQTTFPYADYQTKVAAAIRPGRVRTWCSSSTAGSTISSPASCSSRCRADAVPADEIETRLLPDRDQPMKRGRRILRPADRRALAGALLQQEALQGSRASTRTSRRRRSTSCVGCRQEDHQARRRRQHRLGGHRRSTWPARTTTGGARC